jgi:ABC-type nitrate/sulfonate/bicarbonate transport system substrate-binding protein
VSRHSKPDRFRNDEIRFATGLRAANQSIAWIGARTGVFASDGLTARFPGLEVTGPEAVAGLLRGDWDFAQTGTVPVAEAVLMGGDAVILLRDSIVADSAVVMAQPSVTSLDQLGGKRVGVLTDAYSGQTGVIVRLALERAGAVAYYVGLGTFRNILGALASGQIDAGALPVDFQFLDECRRWSCFEARSLGVPAVLATTRRTIAAHRELVLRMLRGFVGAIHRFKTRPDQIVPLLQEFLDFDDRGAVERVHRHYARLLPVIPRPDLAEGMPDLRDLFSRRYGTARTLAEVDIADPSLIDCLAEGGFIASLYGSAIP